jgi:hypothetical protein
MDANGDGKISNEYMAYYEKMCMKMKKGSSWKRVGES